MESEMTSLEYKMALQKKYPPLSDEELDNLTPEQNKARIDGYNDGRGTGDILEAMENQVPDKQEGGKLFKYWFDGACEGVYDY